MTSHPSPEDLRRRDRALSGQEAFDVMRAKGAAVARSVAEGNAFLKTLGSNAGGTSAPPPRETIDRILGRANAPVSAAAPVDYAEVRAANERFWADRVKSCQPKARGLANQAGIRLDTVVSSGDGLWEITTNDVRAAIRRQTDLQAARRAQAATAAANLTERRSVFLWSQMVRVNEYGTNPLVEDIVQTMPEKAAFIMASGDKPPTLFESGDLPVFTASGVAPAALGVVPWSVRHVIARLGNIDAAHLLNRFTPGPASDPAALAGEALMIFETDDENQAYKHRVATWFDSWQPDYNSADANGFTTRWKKNDTRAWQP